MEDQQRFRIFRRNRRTRNATLTQDILDRRDELGDQVVTDRGQRPTEDSKVILEELRTQQKREQADKG